MDDIVVENINSDVKEISGSIEPLPEIDDVESIENLLKQQGSSSPSFDETELLTAWNELRTLLLQLYKTIIPTAQIHKWQNSLKSKPSISRIQYLSNILLDHDPHRLFTKVTELSQETCIELKVRLLTTVKDSPSIDDCKTFIQGMCESYQWVMRICEASQTVMEKLDREHLSSFGLNWVSVNIHTFYTTVFIDPDVQEYLTVCSGKLIRVVDNEMLECLTSLQRTLMVAEDLWVREERIRYSQPMSFQQKRLDDGSCTYENCNSVEINAMPPNSTEVSDIAVSCPCRSCMSEVDSKTVNVSETRRVEGINSLPDCCDCHFCNAANVTPSHNIGSPSGAPLPPMSQPQLSLYPHIHGTSSDIVSSPSLDDVMRSPVISSHKSPPIPSHLLGSEVLTQQLLREWEMAYGDAISPPTSRNINHVPSFSRVDQVGLVNGMQNLSVDTQSPEIMRSVNNYRMNVPNIINPNVQQTSTNLHQIVSTTTSLCGLVPMSTLNGMEVAASRTSDDCLMNGNDGVITHTNLSISSNKECGYRGCTKRSHERSSSGESSSMGESSGRGEGNGTTSEEYEQESTDDLSDRPTSHCDCCYCHLLGGHKKDSPFDDSGASNESENSSQIDYEIISDDDINEILDKSSDFDSERISSSNISCDIDPERSCSADRERTSSSVTERDSHLSNVNDNGNDVNDTAQVSNVQQNSGHGGRRRYKYRKERLLKILARKKATLSSSSSSNTSSALAAAAAASNQDIDQIMNYIEGRRESRDKIAKNPRKKKEKLEPLPTVRSKKKSSSNEEEEEDGPLAELRRRAPDVTITVVKPGERSPQSEKLSTRSQISISRNVETPPHPLMVRPQQSNTPETWVPPTSRIGANLGVMGMQGEGNYSMDKNMGPFTMHKSNHSQGTSISNLIKNLQPPSNKNSKKEKDGSQMVTIKRVMDPLTADPTVTITLKGAEKKNDEVLLQLINGQLPGRNDSKQHQEPYIIPKGLSSEAAKKYKSQLKKERKKKKKLDQRRVEEEEEQMQQLRLQEQQQLLLQQEKQIKKQQVALQRKQQQLLLQQQLKCGITPKGTGKTTVPKNKKNKKDVKTKALDMSKNYTLPPGVSINKVIGQPGMVTISNNLGGPQPFLSNPNVFSFGGSYRSPGVPPFPAAPMATPYSYGTAWNEANSRRENVIVVDTKATSSKKKDAKANCSNKKDANFSSSQKDVISNISKKQEAKGNESNKKNVKSNVSNKKDVKANVSNKKDVKANVSNKKDVKSNVSNKKDVKANVSNKKDVKSNVSYKKDVKGNVSNKKDVKANVSNKDVKASVSNKKDVKANVSTKKDVKASVSNKKDVKANISNKKDVKANVSNKKDVKANVSNKKNVKSNKKDERLTLPNKKDVKNSVANKKDSKNGVTNKDSIIGISNKKDVKVGSLNKEKPLQKSVAQLTSSKKDTKVNTSSKKEAKLNSKITKDVKPNATIKKVNVPTMKKVEMTIEEKYNAALNGEIDPSMLTKAQRKKLKSELAIVEKEKAEQREEDELMDKMYNISLGNHKSVNSTTKKVKRADESKRKREMNDNQTGGMVKKLQKSTSQPSKEGVPKLKSKLALEKEISKSSSKKVEEPRKPATKDAQPNKKPEVIKQLFKNAQKTTSKITEKLPIVGQVVTRKQQFARVAATLSHQRTIEKSNSTRGVDHTTKKSGPLKQTIEKSDSTHGAAHADKKINSVKQNIEKSDSTREVAHTNKKISPMKQNIEKFDSAGGVAHTNKISSVQQNIEKSDSTRGGAHTTKKISSVKPTNEKFDSDHGVTHTADKNRPLKQAPNSIKKQNGKAKKKTSLDDDVFNPNYHDTNLDEADREVEAFKRFCLENPKGKPKEKLKVEFDIKDIMITKEIPSRFPTRSHF